jgi:hypothetical protein
MLLMFFSESRSNGYDTQQQPPGAVCGETLSSNNILTSKPSKSQLSRECYRIISTLGCPIRRRI